MMNRDVRLFLAFAVGKVFVGASGFFITALIGRLLGPAGLGQWALVTAAAAFLHTTLLNWTHASTIRFGCEEWATAHSLRRTFSARFPLLLAGAAVAAFLLIAQPFRWLSVGFAIGPGAPVLVALYAVALWLTAEAQATLQAADKMDWQALLGPVVGAASIVALLVLGVGGWATLTTAVLAVALTTAVLWGSAWLRLILTSAGKWQVPSWADVRGHVAYAGPLLFAFGVGYVSDWGDHLLLRRQTSLEVVGQFGLSYQMFTTMLAANGVLTTLVLPRLLASHARSTDATGRYFSEVVPTIFVLWALGATAVVALLPPLLTTLAGGQFQPAARSLIVLCAIVPTSVITSLYTVLFSLQKRLGRVLVYTTVMTAANLGLSLLLIPAYGAAGAAAGTAASYAIAQAAYLVDQHHHLGASSRHVGMIWAIVVLCGFAQILVGPHLGARLAWAIVAGGMIVLTAKRTHAVSPSLIDRLFSGTLSPVGAALRWTLASATS